MCISWKVFNVTSLQNMISFDISKDKPPPPQKKKNLLKYFVRKYLNVHRYFNEIVINKITLHVKKCQTLKKENYGSKLPLYG